MSTPRNRNNMQRADRDRLRTGPFASTMDAALKAVGAGKRVAIVTDQLDREDSYSEVMDTAAQISGRSVSDLAAQLKLRQAYSETSARSSIEELQGDFDQMIVLVDGIGPEEVRAMAEVSAAEMVHGGQLSAEMARAQQQRRGGGGGSDDDESTVKTAPTTPPDPAPPLGGE